MSSYLDGLDDYTEEQSSRGSNSTNDNAANQDWERLHGIFQQMNSQIEAHLGNAAGRGSGNNGSHGTDGFDFNSFLNTIRENVSE